MSAREFAVKLEDAASRIGDIPRAELAILLRRAALRLRNTGRTRADDEDERQEAGR